MSDELWQPEILETNVQGDHVRMHLKFSDQLQMYKGHFPQFPITPGVILVHIVCQQAKKHFHFEGKPMGLPVIKFMSPLVPEVSVQLELTKKDNTVSFTFLNSTHKLSTGKVQFGS